MLSFLILCCLSSCHSWDWKPDVYAPDYERESITNASGIEVLCRDQHFEDFLCFTGENIADLKKNIERCKTQKSSVLFRLHKRVDNLKVPRFIRKKMKRIIENEIEEL